MTPKNTKSTKINQQYLSCVLGLSLFIKYNLLGIMDNAGLLFSISHIVALYRYSQKTTKFVFIDNYPDF